MYETLADAVSVIFWSEILGKTGMNRYRKYEWVLVTMGLCIFLLIIGGYFLRHVADRERKGADPDAWVTVAEIKESLSFGVYENEDWDAFFGSSHKEYLTGGMLEQLMGHLGVDGYIEAPEYAGNQNVSRADWDAVYGQLLDLLDMERQVTLEKLLVLDVMEASEVSVLITNQGDYYTTLPPSYFEKWSGYELYCIGERCISLAGMATGELKIDNAYITQCRQGEISFLFKGAAYQKGIGELLDTVESGVCDIVFSGGEVLSLRRKEDLIEGRLLGYDGTTIEIEGYGRIRHAANFPVYQIYGEAAERSLSDVIIGNMEVAYVTGEGEVCAILIRQPADIQNIRVLLLADGGSNFRDAVYLVCDGNAAVSCGTYSGTVEPGQMIGAADFLADQPDATLVIAPKDDEGQITICDSTGEALSGGYRGSMEVRSYEAGYTVVNQLPLETYLWAVVPSEMPSSYEPEALKAQAVCARSYAYIQLLRADLAEYGAHINDGTSYQVYNKVAATEQSRAAVEATAGQLMTCQGNPIEAYYFSTSMGYTDTAEVWNVEDISAYPYLKSVCLNMEEYGGNLSTEDGFLSYIREPALGYDSDIKFYRWTAEADYSVKEDEISRILNSRRAVSERNVILCDRDGVTELSGVSDGTLGGFGAIRGITVAERSGAGAILTLKIQYEKGTVLVRSEYNIRLVLGACTDYIVYADGSKSEQVTMLPSAYCAIVSAGDGALTLYGGGYGHGIGMSQNAANGMAKAGMDYEQILHYFYNDIMISTLQ